MTRRSDEDLKKMLAENLDLAKANPDLSIDGPSNASLVFGSALPSKYHAKRTEYNGVLYASKKEAEAAQELDLRKRAGGIDFWLRQVNFPLPGRIVYRADFVTFAIMQNRIVWRVKVIEIKGYKTEAWNIKRKLFVETYPHLELEVV